MTVFISQHLKNLVWKKAKLRILQLSVDSKPLSGSHRATRVEWTIHFSFGRIVKFCIIPNHIRVVQSSKIAVAIVYNSIRSQMHISGLMFKLSKIWKNYSILFKPFHWNVLWNSDFGANLNKNQKILEKIEKNYLEIWLIDCRLKFA